MTRHLLPLMSLALALPLFVGCVPGPRTPVDGVVTQAAGSHPGIDMAEALGRPIIAICRGTVVYAGPAGNCGNLIEINHDNGYKTRYCHLSGFAVRPGPVGTGQVIGFVGSTGYSTGPHLHFELYHDGVFLPAQLNAAFPLGSTVHQGAPWGGGLDPALPCP